LRVRWSGQRIHAPLVMATLLYETGLRLLECARLRVEDVGVDRR
jgi:integrase